MGLGWARQHVGNAKSDKRYCRRKCDCIARRSRCSKQVVAASFRRNAPENCDQGVRRSAAETYRRVDGREFWAEELADAAIPLVQPSASRRTRRLRTAWEQKRTMDTSRAAAQMRQPLAALCSAADPGISCTDLRDASEGHSPTTSGNTACVIEAD